MIAARVRAVDDGIAADGTAAVPERIWSLRREWVRAFAVMLVLLLVAAVATIVGVRGVFDQIRSTATELHVQSEMAAELRSRLVLHEQVGHQLLWNKPADRAAFIEEQQSISHLFEETATVFPNEYGMRATILEANDSWREGLAAYGLWGDDMPEVLRQDDSQAFGASSDETRALLDGLAATSLTAMDRGLVHGDNLERTLLASLVGLFALALAATMYFSRRMAKDLMLPVARLHEGVLRLQDGDYDHRIDTARRDELGELAEAFNGMAGALHENHLALTRRATLDTLTGLANRASLTESLTASFGSGDRRHEQESLLFIDIDDFKEVNDSMGHEGGDALLVQMAGRLNRCVRAGDLVARLGGDEFAILALDDDDGSAASGIAERILDVLRAPFTVCGDSLIVTVSIGVARRDSGTVDEAALLRHADFAMYMAKGAGKARHEFFDAVMYDHMVERSALRTDLATAASSGQLRLDYQPITALRTGEILGVEALVRWQHPTLGLLAPEAFIPLAEETGDIDAIGCWVLDTATREVAGWRQEMDHCRNLWVSVNLSAFQLPNPRSLASLERILANPEAQADRVVLEVTETALAIGIDDGVASLNRLKGLGVRIAIDDFGTGFSSLSTLAGLPVDILKLGRSFFTGQAPGAPSVAMLDGILGLAGKLSLTVIAEGIETAEQRDLLYGVGCRIGQGYLLARPGASREIKALLASGGLVRSAAELENVTGS